MARIAIVMVNYKTPELVTECIDSIARHMPARHEIRLFIGDAASGDNSVETISQHIAAKGHAFAECFDIGANGGFAYGNNFILKKCVLPDPSFDYVHFLNPDTYVHAGAISELANFLDNRPKAAVAGSRLENPDGSHRAYGFRFPAAWREFFGGARLALAERLVPSASVKIENLLETREVDWVTGASFMMPRWAIEKVGLWDAAYFLYFEEVDLMFRARKAGFEVWHVSTSRIVHLQGQATGVRADDAPKRLPSYWYQSRFKFFHDNYGKPRAVAANVLFLAGDLIYRAHRLMRRKPIDDAPFVWRDMISNGFSLPEPRIREQ